MTTTDSSSLLHGYDLLKQTLSPYVIPVAVYANGELTTYTLTSASNIVKKTANVVITTYRESQKLVLKGIITIAEQATSGNIPNITTTKPNTQFPEIKLTKNNNAPSSILDISLVRKPNFADFIKPEDYTPITSTNLQKLEIIALPSTEKDRYDIKDKPHTWIT